MNRRGCFPENVIYKQPVGRFPYRPQSADPWARGKGDDEKIWRVQTKGTHPGRRYYYYSIHGLEPGHKVGDGGQSNKHNSWGCQALAPVPPQSKHKACKHQRQKRGNKDDMGCGIAEKRGSRPGAGQD